MPVTVIPVYGDQGNDTLSGGAGQDRLYGGGGRDRVIGQAGRDILSGGADADIFQYNSVTDSTVQIAGRDTINDFNAANTDRISLTNIDANADGGTANDAFTFRGTAAFTGLGQVRYAQNGANTIVSLNTTGSIAADMEITLTGVMMLNAADFLL